MGRPEGSFICIISFSIFGSFSGGKGKGKGEGREIGKRKKEKKNCMPKDRGNVIDLTVFKCLSH